MRIAKNTTQRIDEAPSLRFMLVVDLMDGDITVEKEGKTLLSLALNQEGSVIASLFTPKGCITLEGENAAKKEVILTASYARYGLYVNGVLLDEDFFFAPIDYIGATVKAGSFMHFEAGYEYHSMPESAIVENVTEGFDGFRPYGKDMALKRPYPTVIRNRLHVFYLDARREGRVKKGMGAHRLCALFTEDGEHICSAPIALPIDSIEEKAVVDATAVTVGERTYLYYLVDYRSHRALTAAVSDDGFSYVKTGLDIEIPSVDNAGITSISTFMQNGEVFLAYTVSGKPYIAKSIDLLHFAPPRPLALDGDIDGIFALSCTDKAVYFAQRNGESVYGEENGAWRGLSTAYKNARPVFFDGKYTLFGEENGTLKTEAFTL